MSVAAVRVAAVICSREQPTTPMLTRLIGYFDRIGIQVCRVVGAPSIFSGYQQGAAKLKPQDGDVLILCHDDVEILSADYILEDAISVAIQPNIGLVGPVGIKDIPDSGWIGDGDPSGIVITGSSPVNFSINFVGAYGPVKILDGMFVIGQWKKLKEVISQGCPLFLKDGWHFYDLYYSLSLLKAGYQNVTYPIFVLHQSRDYQHLPPEWTEARNQFQRWLLSEP